MEKYVTMRQRKEQKFRKLRRLIISIVILAVLCLVVLIYTSAIRKYNVKPSKVNDEYGSESLVCSDPKDIPDYSGDDSIVLNDGKPCFNQWDMENIIGEHYSELDSLGRCGAAYAMLDRTMMPTGERGEIGHIKPTGWHQAKYEGIVQSEPPYLYNRCHLIAYALTGQNDNVLNLITGTRYMVSAKKFGG